MPLSIVTQGLVHASLGGTLVTTASILLAILAWGVISVLATMFGSRTARRADRSERAVRSEERRVGKERSNRWLGVHWLTSDRAIHSSEYARSDTDTRKMQ